MQRATTRYGRVAVCRTVVGWFGCWLFALPVCGQQPPAGAEASRGIQAAESSPVPARGGGQQADFDSLIELITATVAPDTWQDVGGEGAIQGFPGGVYVDASGLLQRLSPPVQERLTTIWSAARLAVPRQERDRDVDRFSALRKVSLRRLQQYLEQLQREGTAPTPAARFLAGLQRVDAVWLDHAAGDCILAGPAGAWTLDREGRCVGVDSGRPVLRLDDWLVLLRQAMEGDGQFLCAITPTQENLSRTQDFLEQSAGRPVPTGRREAWLEELRDALGKQRIEIAGIDPESRVARVIVEADYHMKLVGLGLLPGTDELVNYLDAVERSGLGAVQELGVLRWWFTLRDHSVERGEAGQLYLLADPMVQLLSENELLAARGHRVHTGRAEPLNQQFARDFTGQFQPLARKYPVYAELDNVFRLAVVAAVLRQSQLTPETDGAFRRLLDTPTYDAPRGRAPREVYSVVSFREIDRRHFVAAVSGGVSFRSEQVYSSGFAAAPAPGAGWTSVRPSANQLESAWWWD